MRKITKSLGIVIISIFFFSIECKASDTIIKINDLIENSISMDGKKVIIQGEVIGEELERGEYAWININDGSNAIGVWIKQDLINNINYYGNYKNSGDIVQITAIYHRACREHGGDIDLHSTNFKIISSGYSFDRQISLEKMGSALLLSFLSIVLITYFLIVKKKTIK